MYSFLKGACINGIRAHFTNPGLTHLDILKLIIFAKTHFPHKLLFRGCASTCLLRAIIQPSTIANNKESLHSKNISVQSLEYL